MDFLNQAYRQVADLLMSMSLAGRITTGLLLAVLVVSLAMLFRQGGQQADDYLFGGEILSQSEIAAMEAAFSKKGLNQWEVIGNRIRIPRSQRSKYIVALAEENAFPETPGTALEKMFVSDSPLMSNQMRQLQARHARERSLALTIEEISGIDVAQVQIEEIDSGEFPKRMERRALVSVKADGNHPLTSKLVETIRNMVAFGGGVEDKNITVTDLNTGQAYPGVGDEGPLADNLYAKHQRALEENLKTKIIDRLAMYPGIKVAVHVELNEEMVNQTISNKYDPKPTTIELTDFSKESTSTHPELGGRPGVVPNTTISNVPQQIQTANSESTLTERRENQRSVAGVTHTVSEKVPFAPTWMGVSIGIPRTYFTEVWRRRNAVPADDTSQQPDPAELKTIESEIVTDIETAVNPLLPKVAQGEDPYPRVSVVPYTEAPLVELESPTTTAEALTWLGSHWQSLALGLLALASIFFLRGMIRASQAPVPTPTVSVPVEQLAALEEEPLDEEDEVELANSLKARFHGPQRSLRDELTDLVREDPDAAAAVLNAWIGDAA